VTNPAYDRALDIACDELETLLQRRAKISSQIKDLQQTIETLSKHAGRNTERGIRLMTIFAQISAPENRLTDAVKDALYSAFNEHGPRKLPPVQIMELLEERGFDFKDVTNPSANLNSALRRLARQGDISVGVHQNGSTVYWLAGSRYGARNSLANILETDRQQSKRMKSRIAKRVDEAISKS
jgi:cell division septum initiation protein DivIVA